MLQRDVTRQDTLAVHEWLNGPGQNPKVKVIRKMPGLAGHSSSHAASPTAHGTVIQYVRDNLASATCAGSLPTDTRTSNVAAALTSLWEGLHKPIGMHTVL